MCEMSPMCEGDENITWNSQTLASCYCEERLRDLIRERGLSSGMKAYRDDVESICHLPNAHDSLLPLRVMLVLGILVPALSPVIESLSLYMVRSEPYVNDYLFVTLYHNIPRTLTQHPFNIRYESRGLRT